VVSTKSKINLEKIFKFIVVRLTSITVTNFIKNEKIYKKKIKLKMILSFLIVTNLFTLSIILKKNFFFRKYVILKKKIDIIYKRNLSYIN